MGIFFNKNNILHELEITDADGNKVPLEDDEENSEESNQTIENTENNEESPEENQTTEDSSSEDNEDSDGNENQEENTEESSENNNDGPSPDESSAGDDDDTSDDYSEGAPEIDTEDDGESSDNNSEGSEEKSNEKSSDNENDDIPNPDSLAADLMGMENKLLSELTPEQLQIKHQELKKKYVEIYDMIDPIINRINNLSKDNATIKIYDFITKKLNELRDLVSHYLIKVYPTKTYTENLINYEEYIAIMHQVDKVLEQIPSENE